MLGLRHLFLPHTIRRIVSHTRATILSFPWYTWWTSGQWNYSTRSHITFRDVFLLTNSISKRLTFAINYCRRFEIFHTSPTEWDLWIIVCIVVILINDNYFSINTYVYIIIMDVIAELYNSSIIFNLRIQSWVTPNRAVRRHVKLISTISRNGVYEAGIAFHGNSLIVESSKFIFNSSI